MSVYFALSSTGLVKIGFSENPKKRICGLRTKSRMALEIVSVLKGDKAVERKMHMRFGRYYSHGEWFFYKGDLKKFLKRHALPKKSDYRPAQSIGMSADYIRLKTIQLQERNGWTAAVARAQIMKEGPP